MPLRNPFRRQDDAPTLRDRAADLKADLARAIRKPSPRPANEATPEAAAHADLAAACDQAVLDWRAIQPKSRAENWGEAQLDEALDAYGAVFKRAIHEPSHTLSETQAKARLLLHDLREHEGRDEGEEHDDKRLMRVVLREVAGLADTVAVSEFCGIDFGPDTHIAELAAEFCRVYGRHAVKDRAHMAGELAEAEWLPSYRATVALMEKLEATRPKTLLGAALKCLGAIGVAGWNARADGSTEGLDPWERVGVQFQDALMADELAPISISGPDLVGLVNFPAATLDELHAVHDMADEVSAFAYALVSTGRGSVQDRCSYDDRLTPAGNLMLWVAEALTSVEAAAWQEIRARQPTSHDDQETRLRVLASLVIANGDKAETADFAREILAFAER